MEAVAFLRYQLQLPEAADGLARTLSERYPLSTVFKPEDELQRLRTEHAREVAQEEENGEESG